MAAELEKLAQYYIDKGNQPRANLFRALAAEERATGGLETVVPELQVAIAASIEAPAAKTPEANVEIKRFSKEALEFLKKKGLLSYSLFGQSLQEQRLAGKPFWYIIDAGEKFLTLPSMRSQVAFHPSPEKFFLPKSNHLPLPQQQEMVSEYSYKLQREFGGDEIGAIIGDAPDYTSLAFTHLDATNKKEYLFGGKYNYNYTRTKTPTSGSGVAIVGLFVAALGLRVDVWGAGDVNDGVHVAPLVVPTGK